MHINHKKNERGVALLFALGILSLMTVLALSLASISMEKQSGALDMSFSASAKELADSIVNRVNFQLTEYSSKNKRSDAFLDNLYSQTGANGEYTYDYDSIWKLSIRNLSLNSAIYAMNTMDYTAPEQSFSPTWQYILNPAKDELLARFAYKAVAKDEALIDFSSLYIDSEGKTVTLDPAVPTTTFKRQGFSIANELDPKILWAMIPNTKYQWNEYLKTFSEISKALKDSRFFDYDSIDKIMRDGKKADYLELFAKAFTADTTKYPEGFSTVPYTDQDSNTKIMQRINLVDFSQKVALVNEEQARAKIVEKLVSTGFVAYMDADPVTITNSDSDPNYPKIPWLASFKDSSTTGFSGSAQKAKQIAANMMDFFTPLYSGDKVFYPTSDKKASEWMTTTPTYLGLKRSPYISGTGIQMGIGAHIYPEKKLDETNTPISKVVDGKTYYTWIFKLALTVQYTPYVELVNLWKYEHTGPDVIKLTMGGNMLFDITIPNADDPSKAQQTFTVNFPIGKVAGGDTTPFTQEALLDTKERVRQYYSMLSTTPESTNTETPVIDQQTVLGSDGKEFTVEAESEPTDKIPSIGLNIMNVTFQPKIKLEWTPSSGVSSFIPVDFADLTNLDKIAIPRNPDSAAMNLSQIQTTASISLAFAAKPTDPRHNLTADSWKDNKRATLDKTAATFVDQTNYLFPTVPAAHEGGGTLYPATTGADGSKAPVANTDYSLADSRNAITLKQGSYDAPNLYLREAPIEFISNIPNFSADELSYIHRAGDWQSLNLTTYDASATETSYDNGDLELLNQLKLTSEKYSYGKINLNAVTPLNSFAIAALLKNSYKEELPDVDAAQKDPETEEDLLKTVKTFFANARMRTVAPYFFNKRIDIAEKNDSLFKNYSKEIQRRIIPKLIFLLDAEPTYLPRKVYVFALAQILEEKASSSKDWKASSEDDVFAAGYSTAVTGGVKITPSDPRIPNKKTGTLLKYDNGCDEILAEQQLFSILERPYTTLPYYNKDSVLISNDNKPEWKQTKVTYGD